MAKTHFLTPLLPLGSLVAWGLNKLLCHCRVKVYFFILRALAIVNHVDKRVLLACVAPLSRNVAVNRAITPRVCAYNLNDSFRLPINAAVVSL
jgi:hypothetical protein